MMPTGSVIVYLLLPAVGVLLGGVVGALRTLPPLAQSAIQHFAAGVVFAAIATEIVPDVMHGGAPRAALAGFAIGVALMFGLRAVAERLEAAGAGSRAPSRAPRPRAGKSPCGRAPARTGSAISRGRAACSLSPPASIAPLGHAKRSKPSPAEHPRSGRPAGGDIISESGGG